MRSAKIAMGVGVLVQLTCTTPEIQFCNPPSRCCDVCHVDLDQIDGPNFDDIAIVLRCREGGAADECADADINCDGNVDLCDAEHVLCAYNQGGACCAEVACGACMTSSPDGDTCELAGEETCEMFVGDYLGDRTTCG